MTPLNTDRTIETSAPQGAEKKRGLLGKLFGRKVSKDASTTLSLEKQISVSQAAARQQSAGKQHAEKKHKAAKSSSARPSKSERPSPDRILPNRIPKDSEAAQFIARLHRMEAAKGEYLDPTEVGKKIGYALGARNEDQAQNLRDMIKVGELVAPKTRATAIILASELAEVYHVTRLNLKEALKDEFPTDRYNFNKVILSVDGDIDIESSLEGFRPILESNLSGEYIFQKLLDSGIIQGDEPAPRDVSKEDVLIFLLQMRNKSWRETMEKIIPEIERS